LSGGREGRFLLRPRIILRAEFALGFALALLLYERHHGNWLLFIALFFVPDLTLAAYLAGNRAGAACYNAIHTLVVPVILVAAGVLWERPLLVLLALILFAHIALDRTLGFGLKYPGGPRETHLQRV
jgi:Domain of unknown function (DUF4260)